MMSQCKQCLFYDKEYDKLRQQWDDIIIVGQEDVIKYYCYVHSPIPQEILNDQTKCFSFVLRDVGEKS